MSQYLNIVADGSYSTTQGGGWAFYVRFNSKKLIRKGKCPNFCTSSNHVELAAIYAAIRLGLEKFPAADVIRVCSDSKVALKAVEDCITDIPMRDPVMHSFQTRIQKIISEPKRIIKCTWVAGHQHPDTGKNEYKNNYCDLLAKVGRKEEIDLKLFNWVV